MGWFYANLLKIPQEHPTFGVHIKRADRLFSGRDSGFVSGVALVVVLKLFGNYSGITSTEGRWLFGLFYADF